jgi:hypothetical protein
MSVKFSWDGQRMQQQLAQGNAKALVYLTKTTQYWSLRVEAQARRNARWTDRTTNARSGLSGTYQVAASGAGGGGTFTINLAHSVPYGIYLETVNFTHKGRLNIIKPTMDQLGPQFFKQAQAVIDRIFS